MIVSPRAKEVLDVLRIDGKKLIEVDEVFLYTRIGVGAPYRKIRYWKREIDRPEGEGRNTDRPEGEGRNTDRPEGEGKNEDAVVPEGAQGQRGEEERH